jgi:polo-like kinase 1
MAEDGDELDKNIQDAQNEYNEQNSDPDKYHKADKPYRPLTTYQSTKALGTVLNTNKPINLNDVQKAMYESETFVSKWVDYSKKYGLGYILSDGTSGAVFNDDSRLMLSAGSQYMEYLEQKGEGQPILTTYNLSFVPDELKKKLTLLKHFRGYLDGEEKFEGRVDYNAKALIYVKKWVRTKNAHFFKLSNRVVQVDFKDKKQIILSPVSRLVQYRNKRGEKQYLDLQLAIESENQELVKRLNYTKEILAEVQSTNPKDGDLRPSENPYEPKNFPNTNGATHRSPQHGRESAKEFS